MTTLIAFQHDDFCVIAADTQTTNKGVASDCATMGKIAKNGKYLVSAAGYVRGINLIQHAFHPPVAPRTNLDKFMVNVFIPELRKTFIKSGYDIKSDGDPASHDSEIIVAVNGVLYFIDEVYGIERNSTRLYVAGSGQDFALGAAYALGIDDCDDYEEAVDILEKAVRASMKFDIHSSGKVQIALQTKDGKSYLDFLD